MTPTTVNYNRRAIPWALGACLLWSSAFAGVKYGLSLGYVQPLTFAGIRFMLAGLLLVPLCGSPVKALRTVGSNLRYVLTVSLLQTILLYSAFFYAVHLAGGAQTAIITGSSPLAAAVLAHFFMTHDRMTFGKTGAIALGMAGVVLIAIAAKPWSPAGLSELAGMGLSVFATICSGLANVFVARHRGDVSPVVLNCSQMFIGGAVLLAAATLFESPPAELPDWRFLAILGYLASVSAIGFTIWFYWLKRVKVSQLNMWKFVIPLCGAMLAWLIIPGESPNVPSVIGMVCVAAAVYLAYRQSNSQDTDQAA